MPLRPTVISYSQDAPTRLVGTMFDLKQGQTRTFRGSPMPTHRKWIRIYNEDNGTKLQVIVPGSDPDLPVRMTTIPLNSWAEFWTSDEITIAAPEGDINISGKVGAIQVMECFYA